MLRKLRCNSRKSSRPIDPLGRPAVTAGSAIIVFARVVCPSVRSHFSKISKTKKYQEKTIFTTGETEGLAEWIIDDPCLVFVFVFTLRP